jgi:hypothetical protein
MKNLLLTILVYANFIGLVSAQNVLFVDFQNAYHQVVESMQDRSYVEIESSEPGEELVVSAQGATYIYRFNQGWLYEIEMKRGFAKRRPAKQAYQGCQEYFDLIGAEQVAVVEAEKYRKEEVYVRTGRVYRLQYKMMANGRLDVSLRSRYTANTPLTEWEPYDYEAGYEIVHTLNQ